MIATRVKYGNDINASKRPKKDGIKEETESRIAELFDESLFHSSRLAGDNGLAKGGMYFDRGDDQTQEKDEKLAMRADVATKNGMTKEGPGTLGQISEKHR